MLNEDNIQDSANSKAYVRGSLLAMSEQNVFDRKFKYGARDNIYSISAKVFSSSGIREYFRTEVLVDAANNDLIIDYACSCPAADRFDGMCKHSVATALSFVENPTTFQGFSKSKFAKDTQHGSRESSADLKSFLRECNSSKSGKASKANKLKLAKAGNNCTEQSFASSMHLHPILKQSYYDGFLLSFKIQSGKTSYVVKDIDELVENVVAGNFVTYGKKLAFRHNIEVFDESSQRILHFLTDTYRQIGAAMESLSTRYYLHGEKFLGKREAQLDEFYIARFLDALQDARFDLDREYKIPSSDYPGYYNIGQDHLHNLQVINEDPKINFKIDYSADGYAHFKTGEPVEFIVSDTSNYAILDTNIYRVSAEFLKSKDFIERVYNHNAEIDIAPAEMPSFCANVLPLLDSSFELDAPEELRELVPAEAQIAFYLDMAGADASERILCELKVAYDELEYTLLAPAESANNNAEGGEGDAPAAAGANANAGLAAAGAGANANTTPSASSASKKPLPLRDEELEAAAINLAGEYFPASMTLYMDEEDLVGDLLYEGLARLRDFADVFTTPAFDRLITDKKPRVQMGLSIAGNLINFDVQPTDLSKSELAALMQSYRKRKKYHRLKSGAVMSLADAQLKELDEMMTDLGIKPGQLRADTVELPTYQAFYLDRQYSEAHRDKSFTEYIEQFKAFKNTDVELPNNLQATMREYQIEGYKWLCMLNSVNFGGILADEMGLGKTLQMIAFLLAQKNAGALTTDKPALIVCPASLVYNWQTEFARFAPDVRVVAIDGTKSERRVLFADPAAEVFVCSYDIVRIDSEDFSDRKLSYAVLDEAQYIKNHTTKTTRAIKRLAAAHRFALTGTPIENRLSEVWSIFDFLMPGFMGTYESFRKRYEADVIGGDEGATARLNALVSPFVMRRLKSSVLNDLPEKMDSTVYVHMPDAQRKLYDASEQQLRETLNMQKKKSGSRGVRRGTAPTEKSKIEVLAEITRLRQITLDPSLVFENYKGDTAKADAILELISQAAEAGRKVLVFSQFTSYLDVLAKRLASEGRDFYTITGATPKRERVRLVEAFNTDDVGVFLVSLKAGGTGLNLIGASVVIHADPWWNSAAMNQATDRAHRIGQTRDVDVYKVIAKGTIEERILDLQQRKSDLADAIISESEGIALSALTTDDLLSLLGE